MRWTHMVNNIPDKYLFRQYKTLIIKNKENDVNRLISAQVLYNISEKEAKKKLVFTT